MPSLLTFPVIHTILVGKKLKKKKLPFSEGVSVLVK
jgi:hypothetical protein